MGNGLVTIFFDEKFGVLLGSILGFVVGFVWGRLSAHTPGDNKNFIVVLLTVVFAISVIADMASDTYETPSMMYILMSIILSSVTGIKVSEWFSNFKK